jgi:hypothetical protein
MGKEYSGKGGTACLEHPIPGDEGQVLRACRFKGGQVRNRRLWRAYKLPADDVVDLSQ